MARLEKRRATHLPQLETARGHGQSRSSGAPPVAGPSDSAHLRRMGKTRTRQRLCEITPGHDPNDYEVWGRHSEAIGMINILSADGSLNDQAGPYQGLDRFAARDKVIQDFDALGLLEAIEDREIEIGHSDRSKTPVEPYLSEQWFVRMGDVDGGVVCGRGTANEFVAPGLAQAALDAAEGQWRSPTGKNVSFHPDVRYRNTYINWLAEKRDWCISRQLWWGHQIPIWSGSFQGQALQEQLVWLAPYLTREEVVARLQTGETNELIGPDTPSRLARSIADDTPEQIQGKNFGMLARARRPNGRGERPGIGWLCS